MRPSSCRWGLLALSAPLVQDGFVALPPASCYTSEGYWTLVPMTTDGGFTPYEQVWVPPQTFMPVSGPAGMPLAYLPRCAFAHEAPGVRLRLRLRPRDAVYYGLPLTRSHPSPAHFARRSEFGLSAPPSPEIPSPPETCRRGGRGIRQIGLDPRAGDGLLVSSAV